MDIKQIKCVADTLAVKAMEKKYKGFEHKIYRHNYNEFVGTVMTPYGKRQHKKFLYYYENILIKRYGPKKNKPRFSGDMDS